MSSVNNYDKEIGLRELVLQELTDIVDDLVVHKQQNPKQIYTEDNKYCILLTICLERCITFGMKDSGFFAKRDFFAFLAKGSIDAKDEYLQQDFNSVQQLLLKNSGKARAWVRKTINESHLATSLYSLASDREFIKSWYEPFAIMSTNAINDLYKEIEKLEQFHFSFNTRDRMLDTDELFALPPSQYRGQENLIRIVVDGHDPEPEQKKKKKKKKKDKDKDIKIEDGNGNKKKKLKRAKSRKAANDLNIEVDPNKSMPFDPNKSMPHSDNNNDSNNNTPRTKEKKKKTKKNKKKKKHKENKENEHDEAPYTSPQVFENLYTSLQRTQSLNEWQQSQPSTTQKIHKVKSESSIITVVNKSASQSRPSQNQSARPKSGSISERMQTKLQSIPIKISKDDQRHSNHHNNSTDDVDKVFRVSSPSDYLATFRWHDAAEKDNSAQIIKSLYDHEHNENNKKNFPDPQEYEEKAQQFLQEIDADDNGMNEAELYKFEQELIQNAPADPNESGDHELSLSSEPEEEEIELHSHSSESSSSQMNNVNTIHEHIEHNPPAQLLSNNNTAYYSPDDNKSSTATSNVSISALSESKKEEILSKNDEYMAKKHHNHNNNIQSITSGNNSSSATRSTGKYAPECETFLHFTHATSGQSNDPNKNSLNIYLQSDRYFADENVSRDKRKLEQDKEAKKRLQREQDVMRGNDSSSIQKSLNESGMSGDNKPLDALGNNIVLPSTGIILDAHKEKSSEAFFVEQNGQCFSCGDHLGSASISRQCYYTQRLFCALCMDGTVSNIIPSQLIHSLDTRKYPISANSKKHLDCMYDVPAVPLSKIDLPSWYIPSDGSNVSMLKNTNNSNQGQVEENNMDGENKEMMIPNQNEKYYKLIKLGEYLEILSYIKQYYYNNKECFDINLTVGQALGRRPYLLDAYCTDKDSFGYFFKIIDQHKQEDRFAKAKAKYEDNESANVHIKSIRIENVKPSKYRLYGLISMRDMFELFNKDLLTTMHLIQEQITNHIKGCKHCKKRSYGANVQFISKFSDVLQ